MVGSTKSGLQVTKLAGRDLFAGIVGMPHLLCIIPSLFVAVMNCKHLNFLTTNNPDFERIPGPAVRVPIA